MYTNNDLEQAVEKGIFSTEAVKQFRQFIQLRDNTYSADEENIKLLTSFNDIFVVMACALLVFSAGWLVASVHPSMAALTVVVLSWLLAEFFVRKRKMALPAIVLLATYVASAFLTISLLAADSDYAMPIAALGTTIATWCHWKRFHVPITVAVGVCSTALFVILLLISLFPMMTQWITALTWVAGIIIFILAMRWDATDRKRVTGKSDVAFWLHLAAAPLIVHPIFTSLGILDGNQSMLNLLLVLLLYTVLTMLSLVTDRRAFMVSALVYVVVAITQLLENYGEANNMAYAGVFVGFSLLLLSGFWHKTRQILISRMPQCIQIYVPK